MKNYFQYSKRERNGMFVLALLCVAVLLLPRIYRQFKPVQTALNFSDFKREIETFVQTKEESKEIADIEPKLFYFNPNLSTQTELQQLGLSPKVSKTLLNFRTKGGRFFRKEDLKKIYGITAEEYKRLEPYIKLETEENPKKKQIEQKEENTIIPPLELFEFDPNVASKDTLQKLGFSERAANNLIKFRAKGGTIRQKEDIAKIYGVDEFLYEQLLPYIILKKKTSIATETSKLDKPKERTQENVVLDINAASIDDWQKLRGIGPFYARKIINFRNKLGGFYAIHQVADTYNLPDSVFQQIQSKLVLDQPPQQMKLNTVTVEALAKHPYINYQQAKVIINYRQQHGAFKTLDDLQNIIILSPEFLEKIEPYLSFE